MSNSMTPKRSANYRRLARESPVLHWVALIAVIAVVITVFVWLRRM